MKLYNIIQTLLRIMLHLGGASDVKEARYRWLDQPQKRNGSALAQSGRMGHQIVVDRGIGGPQCTAAWTNVFTRILATTFF